MTLDRGSFSSLRDVRHAACDVSGYNATCSQVDTYLRHYFYNSNKGILYHSGLSCVCKHHTVDCQRVLSSRVAQEAECGWYRTAREITGPESACDMITINARAKAAQYATRSEWCTSILIMRSLLPDEVSRD